MKTSTEVKSFALRQQGSEEARAELRSARAAGWFDVELFESWEESNAAAAAREAEEAQGSAA